MLKGNGTLVRIHKSSVPFVWSSGFLKNLKTILFPFVLAFSSLLNRGLIGQKIVVMGSNNLLTSRRQIIVTSNKDLSSRHGQTVSDGQIFVASSKDLSVRCEKILFI